MKQNGYDLFGEVGGKSVCVSHHSVRLARAIRSAKKEVPVWSGADVLYLSNDGGKTVAAIIAKK